MKFAVVLFWVIAKTNFELWPQIVTLTLNFLIMVYLFAKFDAMYFSKF